MRKHRRQLGVIVTELAGIFVGMLVLAGTGAFIFFTEGPKAATETYQRFCEQTLRGKWDPKPTPENSCPGGNWENVFAQPKTGPKTPTN